MLVHFTLSKQLRRMPGHSSNVRWEATGGIASDAHPIRQEIPPMRRRQRVRIFTSLVESFLLFLQFVWCIQSSTGLGRWNSFKTWQICMSNVRWNNKKMFRSTCVAAVIEPAPASAKPGVKWHIHVAHAGDVFHFKSNTSDDFSFLVLCFSFNSWESGLVQSFFSFDSL